MNLAVRCALFVGIVVLGVACRSSADAEEDFGKRVLTYSGWSVRVQNEDSNCIQAAPLGTAYSSSWWCFSDPEPRSVRAMVVGDGHTVVYGRSGQIIDSVVVRGGASSKTTRETARSSGGIFLAVLPPLDGGVELRGLDVDGRTVTLERVAKLPTGARLAHHLLSSRRRAEGDTSHLRRPDGRATLD